MSDLLNWLNDIPPFAWTGFISLFSALLVAFIVRRGVLDQIRNENERFERKLVHEREEKTIEREMEMKRDVFMTVCEALASGSGYLSKFADFEVSEKDHSAIISNVLPRLYRVHLIAKMPTIKALIDVQDFLVKEITELAAAKYVIVLRKIDSRNIQEQIKQSSPKDAIPLYDELSDLDLNIFQMQMALTKQALRAAIALENLGSKSVIAMREELGFPIDAALYSAQLSEVHSKALQVSDSLIEKIKAPVLAAMAMKKSR
jgi:hypothetical protein